MTAFTTLLRTVVLQQARTAPLQCSGRRRGPCVLALQRTATTDVGKTGGLVEDLLRWRKVYRLTRDHYAARAKNNAVFDMAAVRATLSRRLAASDISALRSVARWFDVVPGDCRLSARASEKQRGWRLKNSHFHRQAALSLTRRGDAGQHMGLVDASCAHHRSIP